MYLPTSTILILLVLTSIPAILTAKDETTLNLAASPPSSTSSTSSINGEGALGHFSRILPETANSILATNLELPSHISPSPGWSAPSWVSELTQPAATGAPTAPFDGYSTCGQFVGHTSHCIFPSQTTPWNNSMPTPPPDSIISPIHTESLSGLHSWNTSGANATHPITRTKSQTQTLTGTNTHSTILTSSLHSSSTPGVLSGPKQSDAGKSIHMLAWQGPVMLFLGLFAAVNLVWSGVFGDLIEGEEEE
ncbi:hypothetical protein B0J14DRAFT_639766 [Halenospora varia]|nr:hypothetical protein B0J14DRAFT_639766 [Halenospora varia]